MFIILFCVVSALDRRWSMAIFLVVNNKSGCPIKEKRAIYSYLYLNGFGRGKQGK